MELVKGVKVHLNSKKDKVSSKKIEAKITFACTKIALLTIFSFLELLLLCSDDQEKYVLLFPSIVVKAFNVCFNWDRKLCYSKVPSGYKGLK